MVSLRFYGFPADKLNKLYLYLQTNIVKKLKGKVMMRL